MVEFIVNPTFTVAQGSNEESTEEYQKYRWRWNNNPPLNIIDDFPIHVDFETAAPCNLRCVMCFQSDKEFHEKNKLGYLDFELFKKGIDEGRQEKFGDKKLASIKLNYRGEPLLHPKLVDMVRYAKQKGVVEVMINTNGTLMTEAKARALIDAGIDKVIFSVDGCTKEVYESIRVGAKFDQVVENISRFRRLRDEIGKTNAVGELKPRIRIQAVLQDLNKHQVEDFKKFWGPHVDIVAFDDMYDMSLGSKGSFPAVEKEFACPQLWHRLFVNWNGNITLCCGDTYNQEIVGNLNHDNMEGIWKNRKLMAFRKLHLDGRSGDMKICDGCGLRGAVLRRMINERKSRGEL